MFKNLFKRFFQGGQKQEEMRKLEQQAKEIILRAQEEALKTKQDAEKQARVIMNETLEVEKRLSKKEQSTDEREKYLDREKIKIDQLKKELEAKRESILEKLEKLAKLNQEQARSLLLSSWEDKLKTEVAKKIKLSEEEIKTKSEDRAKEILVDAMRYGATDYVAEYTLSTINIPNDEYKGRIIGKDGRNIRAFEIATGVDVDLEEEGAIKLSSFDAIKREIARVSLERLIKDGRIQPQRIEEIVEKTRSEMEKIIFKAGEELTHKVGVFNLPSDIIRLLGKFKYRYSYGQNMILHTLEETRIGVALAQELKADVNTVKLGCLLHDIGKVITDREGSHVELGVDLLKKHHFPQKIVDCVAAHHEDIPFPSVEAIIVYISDAVSGGRPGARHEDFEQYLKRLTTIEDVAKTKKGVKEAYALQAGRELRVIVKPDEITDEDATILSQKIKEELEKKFDVFPGQINITVVREFRAVSSTKI